MVDDRFAAGLRGKEISLSFVGVVFMMRPEEPRNSGPCMATLEGGAVVLPMVRDHLIGQTVKTQLTARCYTEAAATFDLNDSTWVTFFVQPRVPCWQVLVSDGITPVVLIADINTAGVLLSEGLNVTMNVIGRFYTITLTGLIVDAGTKSEFLGAVLATFTRETAMKRAVRLIQSGGTR